MIVGFTTLTILFILLIEAISRIEVTSYKFKEIE